MSSLSNVVHQLLCRYRCDKTQNWPTKGLKLRGTEGRNFKRCKLKEWVLTLRVQVANGDPLKKASHWICHISSLSLSWCVFLLRPQPSSKTPKVPKIYTKTGDKGRVGTGEKWKGRDGRFPLKVLPYSLQTLEYVTDLSRHHPSVMQMKDAPDKLNDKSKLQNNPELGSVGWKCVCVFICVFRKAMGKVTPWTVTWERDWIVRERNEQAGFHCFPYILLSYPVIFCNKHILFW